MLKRIKNIMIFSFMLICTVVIFKESKAAEYTLVEGGKSIETATEVSMDTEYAATLNGSDVLYFKFTTPAQKGFFDMYTKNITIATHSWSYDYSLKFELIDAMSEVMKKHSMLYGNDITSNFPLDKSTTYYLKVYNTGINEDKPSGNFKFKLSFTPDYVMDSKEEAFLVELEKDNQSTLDGKSDIDYYKFTTSNWNQYELVAQNVTVATHSWASDSQFYVRLLSQIDETKAELRLGYGESGSKVVKLEPNTTYYLRIADPSSAKGQYTFSVRAKQYISDVKLKKENLTLVKGKSYSLLSAIIPADATNKTLEWTTSNKDIVSVSQNGVIKAKCPGAATITVKTTDGSDIEKSCRVIVKPGKTKLKKCKIDAGLHITATVNKQSGISGYQYQLCKKKNFKGKKSTYNAGSTENVATTAILKKNKKYYVRVRSYVYCDGKYYYGQWSNVKKMKTKKRGGNSGYFLWKDV